MQKILNSFCVGDVNQKPREEGMIVKETSDYAMDGIELLTISTSVVKLRAWQELHIAEEEAGHFRRLLGRNLSHIDDTAKSDHYLKTVIALYQSFVHCFTGRSSVSGIIYHKSCTIFFGVCIAFLFIC